MSATPVESDSNETASEFLRLALGKLSQLNLPVNPVNYALLYFYVSGKDVKLNRRLDELFDCWDTEIAGKLFKRFICECSENQYQELRTELLMTVAQILGSVIDLAGKAALSNSTLEKHMQHLAATHEPKDILNIAANIIADTRDFIQHSRDFENNLVDSTQEISLLKDELDHARRMANTDALTGLHNRRGFDRELPKMIEATNSGLTNLCLLILDIDHFKKVNDKHGHLVGDKVLVGISRLLHQQMKGNDHLSRFGGEEFAVILRETPITGAFTVAENLRRAVEKLRLKHVKSGVLVGQVSISIGVACYRRGEKMSDFIHRCDSALYRAKSLGRNRTILAD